MSNTQKKENDFRWEISEKIFALIILIAITLTMFYWDITVTAKFSMIFIDSLFDGKFASFYMNASGAGIVSEGAVYDIGIYIVFAIWGLPVWILNKTFGIDIMSVGCLLWFKLLVVFFFIGTVLTMKRIALRLGFEEKIGQYICYLSGLSLLFVFPILVTAQYDIIPIAFMFYGIQKWMEHDEKKCLLSFSLAFIMKPIAILIYVVLLLLEEKRIRYIMLKAAVSMMPLCICKGIYLLNPANSDSNNIFLAEIISDLLKVSITAGSGGISLFFLACAAIYIAAYLYKMNGNIKIDGKMFIWFGFLLWASFCLFLEVAPYWVVYLAPFLILVLFYNEQRINTSLLLDLIINIGIIASMIISFSWVYGGEKTFSYLVLKPIYDSIDSANIPTVCGALKRLQLTEFQPLINSVVIAAVGAIACLSYRGIQKENSDGKVQIEKWHIRIRIVALYGWMMICLLLLLLGKLSFNI